MRREYTDDDRATALAYLEANKNNVNATARQIGIPVQTLQRWAAGYALNENVTRLRAVKKTTLRAKWEELAERALDAAADAEETASYKDLVMAAAIATDKAANLSDREQREQVVTGAMLERVLAGLESLINSYVTDPAAREIIEKEFAALHDVGGIPLPVIGGDSADDNADDE